MKKVLIAGGASNQEYAPVAGALTVANAATNVGLLAQGGLGIYGFADAVVGSLAAGTLGKDILLNDAGSNTADTGDVDDFVTGGTNEIITIAQGGSVVPVQIYGINRKGVTRVTKQAYSAPVQQVSFIGFNGVSGSINMPTVTQGSEATLLAVQQEASTVDQIRSQEDYGAGNFAAATSEYSVLAAVVTNINTAFTKTHTAFIVGNGTFTNTATNTGTLTLTNGSNVLSFASAVPASTWVAAVGQFISIANTAVGALAGAAATAVNGTIYRIAGLTATEIILDRPYGGASGTISQTNVQAGYISLLTSTTSLGIKLVSDFTTRVYNYAVQGLLQNAPVTAYYIGSTSGTQVQAPSQGLGTGAAVVAIEEGLIAYRGQLDSVDRRMKQLTRYASSSTNYVAYNIQFIMTTQTTGAPHNKSEYSSITIFVPTGQASISSFETILKKLVTTNGANAVVNY